MKKGYAQTGLHLPEQLGVDAADGQRFLALLQPQRQATGVIAHRGGDLGEVDDRAAVDLPGVNEYGL